MAATEAYADVTEKVRCRFWIKVDKRGEDECWPWIAKAKTNFGYGVFGISAKVGVVGAHRMAYMLHHGEDIPKGMMVLHSCDNPACCNPHHLSLGTPLDNMRHRSERGRAKWVSHPGEKNGRALVTWEQVREMRSSGIAPKEAAKR